MDNQELKGIVARYFRGQLFDNEYELLAKYLEDIINREYFEKVKRDWEENPELDDFGQKNLDRLNYLIHNKESSAAAPTLFRQLWFQVVSAAAILITGLFFGSIYTRFIFRDKVHTEQITFVTPRGEKSFLKLPDGTEIWLNANSKLIYNTFSSSRRQVELKGEAFFKVARNEKAPFVVKMDGCDIEVLGTIFNVMDYAEFGRKEITLTSGKIDVHAEGKDQILRSGQALILKDHTLQVLEVNSNQASGWVENKFNFKNIPLSELIKRLENWYDVDITLENNTDREINFTGTFKNEETIWQVLDAIKVYTPISYKKTDLRKIKISVELRN